MKNDLILQEFVAAGALKEGHFILTSGLHSARYVQCALLFTNPVRARKLCQILAEKVIEKFGENFADVIVAPAVGAIVMGYEMGHLLGLETVFCERDHDEKFTFKRDFSSKVAGKRVLIAEIVMTTGKSSIETIECIQSHGGQVVGECIFMNRAPDDALPIPAVHLIKLDIPTFTADNLPEELKKIPAVYPGSRRSIKTE